MPLLGQQMTPIATPLVFSGITQESLAVFAPQLVANGLLPVSGVGGSAAITPLAPIDGNTFPPGSSISVQLVRGDYSFAAAGTVTMRDGDRIYAFGHPFLSLGSSDMPMTECRSYGYLKREQLIQALRFRANGWSDLAGSRLGNLRIAAVKRRR